MTRGRGSVLYPPRAESHRYTGMDAKNGCNHRRFYEPCVASKIVTRQGAAMQIGAARIAPYLSQFTNYCASHLRKEEATGVCYLELLRRAGSRKFDPTNFESHGFFILGRKTRYLYRKELSSNYHGQARTFTNTHEPLRDDELCAMDRAAALTSTPQEELVQRESIQPLRDAIAELPAEQQTAVDALLDGKTVKDTAAELGRSYSGTRDTLNLALWELGTILGAWDDPGERKYINGHFIASVFPFGIIKSFQFKRSQKRAEAGKFTTVEGRGDGVTVIYSVEEDGRPSVIELEAAATNVAHIEIAIYRPSALPTIERIAKGKRRTIPCAGIYKIEACSKKRGQKVSVMSDAEELPDPQRLFSLTEVGKILGIEAQEVVPTMERFLLSPTAGPGGFPHYTKDCLSRVREHLERINAPTDDSPEELLPTTHDN